MAHVLIHALGFLAFGGGLWFSGQVLIKRWGQLGPWHHLAALCLGLAWWIPSLFALAALGALHLGGLAFAALPLLAFMGYQRSHDTSRPIQPTPRTRLGITEKIFAGLLAALGLATFFLTLSPQIAWDADVYHLALPRLYVEHGGFRNVEMNVYSHWPLGTELLFAAAMLIDDYILAKTVHFGFGLATVYALILAFAHDEKRRATGWIAAALFLANGVVAWEFDKAYVDLAHAFFLLTTFLFLHRSTRSNGQESRAFLLLAGLCGGLMAGIKITGILGVTLIALIFLPRLISKGIKSLLVRFALPVALLWSPWLVKAAWYTGNPVYPLFHPLLGGPDWSADLAERFSRWQSSIGMGRETLDYLLLPGRIFLLGERGYARFDGELSLFWLVLIPMALILGRRNALVRQALGAAALLFIFWALSSQQIRFLIPVLPLLALAGADAMVRLLDKIPIWRGREATLLVIAGILVLSVHLPSAHNGFRTLVALMQFQGDVETSAIPEHHRFIRDQVPENSKILFINTNLGFFCPREFLADSFFEASQIADWLSGSDSVEEIRQRLEQRGITHILIDKRPRVDHFPSALGRFLGDPGQVDSLFFSSNGRFVVCQLR